MWGIRSLLWSPKNSPEDPAHRGAQSYRKDDHYPCVFRAPWDFSDPHELSSNPHWYSCKSSNYRGPPSPLKQRSKESDQQATPKSSYEIDRCDGSEGGVIVTEESWSLKNKQNHEDQDVDDAKQKPPQRAPAQIGQQSSLIRLGSLSSAQPALGLFPA
jgi:hypothetical protein